MKTGLLFASLCFCLYDIPASAQKTPELILQQQIPNQNFEVLAFSSDGSWLATSNEYHTQIWDVGAKLQVQSLPRLTTGLLDSLLPWVTESRDQYEALTFLPNSDLIAGLRYSSGEFMMHNRYYRTRNPFTKYSFTLWNWKKQAVVFNIPLQFEKDYIKYSSYSDKQVNSSLITCTPDGTAVILGVTWDDSRGSGLSLFAWSVTTGKLILEKTFDPAEYPKTVKMFKLLPHPDNKQVLIGWQDERNAQKDRIEVWNLYTGQLEKTISPAFGSLCDFSPDAGGKYLFGACYGAKKLDIVRWDLATGKPSPQKSTDNLYKTLDGEFAPASDWYSYKAKRPLFFRHAAFLYAPDNGIYDLTKPGALPAYPEPEHLKVKNGVPIPGSGMVIFNGEQFYDWGNQLTEDLPDLDRPGQGDIERVVFGKDGVISWSETGREIGTHTWELSRLSGVRHFSENEYGATSTGIISTGKDVNHCYNLKTAKETTTAVLGSGAVLSTDHAWAVYDKTVYEWNDKSQKYTTRKTFDNGNDLYYFDPAGTYLYTVAEGKSDECRTCKMITQWKLPQLSKVKQFIAPDDEDSFTPKIHYLEASPDGAWLLALRPGYIVQIFSTRTGALAHTVPFTVISTGFTPDGKQLLLAHGNQIMVYAVPDFIVQSSFSTGESPISCFDFNPEGTRLVVAKNNDPGFTFLSWPQKTIIAQANFYITPPRYNPGHEYMIWTPDNYYCSSKKYDAHFGFQYGDQYYRFEHFDLLNNRPDLVLKTLGYAEPAYMSLLEKTCQKRWEKHKIQKAATQPGAELPEVSMADKTTLPARTADRKLRLQIKASDPAYPLVRLQIMVNEVPLFGPQGKDISQAGSRQFSGAFEVDLVSAKNLIEVQVWNNQGVASPRAGHRVQFDGEIPKPDLYIVTIGVSRYRDSTMNLQYAAKDATDVNNLFKSRFGAFRQVIPFQYLDEAVTKEKILELKLKLNQSRPEDRVIVFAAGHGLLDDKLDFYFGSHDVNFSSPAGRGISFDALESLVGEIPARQKILLLDACHSGELDAAGLSKEAQAQPTASAGSGQKIVFRSVGAKIKRVEGSTNAFDMMKDMFTDLRRQSGAVIISAATGEQVAMEGGGKTNGLFTYALLNGLSAGLPADEDKNDAVTANELQQYILEAVPNLTNGAQQPTYRVEYLYNDFEIWNVKGVSKNPLTLGDGGKTTPQQIKDAVMRGADINGKNKDGATLLMIATHEYNDLELLRWLVSKGADPRLKGTIYKYADGEKTGTYYGNLIAIAVAQNKPALLKYFIEVCKIPVDDREFDAETDLDSGWTGLQWAANEGNLELVKYLLDRGAKPDGLADDDRTPLLLAAEMGHLEIAKWLVQHGANRQIKSIGGHSLLHLAARNGHLEVVRWLVSLGANVNDQDNMGWTPAMFAGMKKQFYCFDYLLSQKADMALATKTSLTIHRMANPNKVYAIPEIIDYQGSERGMFVAIKSRDSLEIARRIPLLKDLNAPDANGGTLLMHLAKETDFLPLIQLLINRGAELRPRGFVWADSVDGGFYGNLQGIAAGKGNLNMLKYFIETCHLEVDGKEFDPAAGSFSGWTALQWACASLEGTWKYAGSGNSYFEPNSTIIDYLLNKGADINIGKNEGSAPLLQVLTRASLSESFIHTWIEEKKADIRVTDTQGRNAIHYFAMYGIFSSGNSYWKQDQDKYYKLFDLNKQDNQGYTPLMLAAFNGTESVAYLLKQQNIQINLANKDGDTALMLAIQFAIQKNELEGQYSYPQQALALLNAAADCSIKNKQGKRAIDLARELGSQELISVLEKKAGCR